MIPRVLLVIVCLAGCKGREREVAVAANPPPPTVARSTDAYFRANASLKATKQGDAFVVSDGAGKMKVTLPHEPTLSGDMISQDGVEVFNAQAVMPGGDVDVQLGAMTVRDGDMPAQMVDMIRDAPSALASAAGGTLTKNEAGTISGSSARVFELTTSDHRRLFGWYVLAVGHARMYQLNCVGDDTPASRTACETIAKSLTLTP
jgi:hypothetical protein